MTQEQFDALIDYINAKIALVQGRTTSDQVVAAHAAAEQLLVDVIE